MAPATRLRRLRHSPRRRAGGVKRRAGTRRREQQEAPAPTETQIRTIQGIVNLFETGSILGDYGNVTIIPGDTGHLTFGRSQTTLGSGGLHLLLHQYCANAGARFGSRLAAYLDRIAARDVSLDGNLPLHNILRATADDPVMRDTQDQFFDAEFFQPALREARGFGITDPLGCAIVYDSFVHGSWERIRDRVKGQPLTRGQREWLTDYVAVRREWLATHPRADLRAAVYRMDAIGRLIDLGAWGLELPLVVRGVEISMATLVGVPPGSFDGPEPGTRELAVVTSAPLCRGVDVRLVQVALSQRGHEIHADGVFGRASARSVAEFQERGGRPVTGVVEKALVATLAAEVLPGVRSTARRRRHGC
jgi:chitosanase